MSARTSVAVVGGGLLGVAVARELAGAGRSVSLFEASDALGGLAGTWSIGSLEWDRYYHVTLASDSHTRELLDAVGLGGELRFRATSTGYWDGAVVHAADSVRDFLRLPGLGYLDKLRVGATIAVNARRRDWRRIERVEARRWLERWSGRRATDAFWTSQLRAKFGDDHERVAATLLWATFRRLDGARRGPSRREQMGHVRGGYARALPAIDAHLRGLGVDVRLGESVDSITPRAEGVGVVSGGETRDFDDVVLTLAAPLTARLLVAVDPVAAVAFEQVRTMGVVCASVVLRAPLTRHYLTYLAAPSPLTAVIDMSALVDPDELGGRGLVYLPRYADPSADVFARSDRDLEIEWLDALSAIYPKFDRDDVEGFAVARAPHVFAVPDVGYSMRVPPLTTAHPRAHVLSSAHLVHATLNVDETVALGTWGARELLARGRIERDRLLARQ